MSECPDCGCADVEVLGENSWWGAPQERVQCRYCGREWQRAVAEEARPDQDADAPRSPAENESDVAGVIFHVIKCPRCGSDATKVTSTQRPVRYHKCLSCEKPFKSVER